MNRLGDRQQLAIVAKLSAPIEHWQLFFGDGTQAGGAGPLL
jgi:hypothetical protein